MIKELPSQFIILNAKLYDGLGNAPFMADVCVNQGRIEAIAKAGTMHPSGVYTIDAEGLALSPGFVDAHSHSDTKIMDNPNADAKISQGVTTEVIGNCGSSATLTKHACWGDIESYAHELNLRQPAVNIVALAGHNTIRSMVMGYENREPTRDEMNQMKEILDKALKQGAAGLSSGLWYLPGKYSKTEEVVELASLLKGTNKPYATHMRSEGDGLLESIDEAMKIAAAGANRLEISHFKTSNKRNWNKLDAAFEKIEEGKRNGMTIFADRYPYIFSCTSLRMVVPAPYDLIANIREFLQTPEHQKEIIQAFEKLGDKGPNWERVIVTDSGVASHKPYIGNNMKENAEMMGLTPPEATIKLLSEGTPQGAFGKMSEENMHRILAKDWVVAGSDASANAYDYTVGRAHPRAFGTFPRFFQFARESAPDEQVIRRMTSLTASMFNIPERGVIKPGYRADLVLFDPDNFQCVFDFKAPHTPCTGVRFVFVNGKLAFDADDPTSRGRHGSFVPIK